MKLLCAEYNEAGEVAYNVIGDNALLLNNDDFYIPYALLIRPIATARKTIQSTISRILVPA